jgi:hypothetical protein
MAIVLQIKDTDPQDVKPDFNSSVSVHPKSGLSDQFDPATTEHILKSAAVDDSIWMRYSVPNERFDPVPLPHAAESALTCIKFEVSAPQPLHTLVERTGVELMACEQSGKSLFIVVGRGSCMTASHYNELRALVEKSGKGYSVGFVAEILRAVGAIAAAVITSRTNASLLVLQAQAVDVSCGLG